jgi:hypothetical protein
MIDWTGDDIRASAFKLSDGNYTVVVEANASVARNLSINFSKNIGKAFNKFVYTQNANPDANLTIISPSKQINVGKQLQDSIGAGYAVYVYTTKPPIKQIALNKVTAECAPGGTVNFSSTLIDCAPGDSVTWSVVNTTNSDQSKKGTITQTGQYTATGAAVGDVIAIKAALVSNPKIYSVALVYVK